MRVQLMVNVILGTLPMELFGITYNVERNIGEVRPKLDMNLT